MLYMYHTGYFYLFVYMLNSCDKVFWYLSQTFVLCLILINRIAIPAINLIMKPDFEDFAGIF